MQTNDTAKFSDGLFQPVVEQCDGCERIVEVGDSKFCNVYVQPDSRWRLGICNFATHAKPEVTVVKVRINPLKAAKRASSKRRG